MWADKTRRKHKRTLLRFLEWQESRRLSPGKGRLKTRTEARGLTRYLRELASQVSGEALLSNARSLLRTLEGRIGAKRKKRILEALPTMRREANRKHPPVQKAAEAIRLSTLQTLLKRAKMQKLLRGEGQALDIFVLAFATMSRVGEVAALETSNVSSDGSTILIRPKTGARTWQRMAKRVSSLHGLRARERLRKRREEADRKGRKSLFPGKGGHPVATSTITARIKRLAKRFGIKGRISSHSARKGAAVEAVLAGVPLPVVQALGGWRDLNTLQAYIGEGLRRNVPLLDILRGNSTE